MPVPPSPSTTTTEPSPRPARGEASQQDVSFALSANRPAWANASPHIPTYLRNTYRVPMLVRPMRGSVSTMALASPALQTSHRSPEHLTHTVALIGAVRGALRSGLLEALQRWQPCTTDELAVRAHLVPRAVDLTLHALAAGGVVAEDAAGWTLPSSPGRLGRARGFRRAHLQLHRDRGTKDRSPTAPTGTSTSCP